MDSNTTFRDLIAAAPSISAIIAAVALAVNAGQFLRNTRVHKLSFVTQVLSDFATNEKYQKVFYQIEYGEFHYDATFHGSDLEKDVDGLLRHFSSVSLAYYANQVSRKDIEPIAYYIYRILGNQEVRKYVKFLEGWVEMARYGTHPFVSLLRLHDELENSRSKKLKRRAKI